VKIVSLLFLVSALLFADVTGVAENNATTLQVDPTVLLYSKIKSYLGESVYAQNKAFINIIFKPVRAFYSADKIDAVKVIKTLKDNGLLKLFYNAPQTFSVSFATSGPPLFFVKIMGQALRSIGYYRYITKKASLSVSNFVWTIDFVSEYAIDPIILNNELHKLGCSVVDIGIKTPKKWNYQIDMQNAHLISVDLTDNKEVDIKRPLYPIWFNVSTVKKVQVTSKVGNYWYPSVVFYDKYLKILKVRRIDKKIFQINFNIPKDAAYMKVTDIYNLQNIKSGLEVLAQGSR
jgi:hypothetical protein